MRVGRILIVIAVVLMAIQAFVAFGTQPMARWEVIDARDPVRIQFSRGRGSMGGPVVGETLRPGHVITDQYSELTARLGETFRFHMGPRTAIDIPPSPARWLGHRRSFGIRRGEVVLSAEATGAARHLEVRLLEGRLTLEGAALVVRMRSDLLEIHQIRGVSRYVDDNGQTHVLEGDVGLRRSVGGVFEVIGVDAAARAAVEALDQKATSSPTVNSPL